MKAFFLSVSLGLLLGSAGLAKTEQHCGDELDLEANQAKLPFTQEATSFPMEDPDSGTDVDVDRIKYLSQWSDGIQVMPTEIASSIRQTGGDQAMRTYRNTIVLGSVASASLLSTYFIPCALMELESAYCGNVSLYGFELCGIGVFAGSSYLAQKFYESERANFEAARNRHQDNLRQLEHIYLDISKALFRNYLSNLSLAKENIQESGANLLEYGEGTLSKPQGEKVLDQFLWDIHLHQDQLLLFSDIIGFLENLDNIFNELLHHGVPESAVSRIKMRFDQLKNLIIGKDYREYKQNLLSLIFYPTESSLIKKRLSINLVITSEDLNVMLPH